MADAKQKRGNKGTPPDIKAQMIEEILTRISNGEPLRQICRDEKMPGWVTVYSWIDSDPNFAERFARARDKGEDAIAQECLDIADNASNDWMEYYDKEGESLGWKLNGDHVQRSKLRIETRLKLLAKWNPKKWGEKLAVGGAADLPPIKNMSDSELEAKIAERLAALKG